MAAGLPEVVVQRIEENEVQKLEEMEFQNDETQVEEVMVMVDEVLVEEREEEFLVVLVWVKEYLLGEEMGNFWLSVWIF